MGKKSDGKDWKATSAAKAAEALAARSGGFGGFSGLQPVAGFGFGPPPAAAAASAAAAAGGDPALPGALDSEIAQCLRHLSKKDATTKLKALQTLGDLARRRPAADAAAALPPWGYHFKRLLMDPAKSVRSEACATMGALAAAVGKALAPQLRALLPPWWGATFDPYADVAAAARRTLAEAFPGPKQAGALVFCRSDVADHIAECLASTPQSLGDPRKDSPEEMEERHERVVAAALSALAALLRALSAAAAGGGGGEAAAAGATDTQQQQQQQQAAQKALSDVQARAEQILCGPGFFKKHFGSKSALVRRSAYGMLSGVCSAAPQLLGGCLDAASQAALGALGEREPANHPAMWEMVLTFVNAQAPACWQHVSCQKMLLPRLWALLRHGCYGSAVGSLPALLPFVAALPRQLLAPAAPPAAPAEARDVQQLQQQEQQQQQEEQEEQLQEQGQPFMASLCDALWQGLQHCGGGLGRAATVAAYTDVLGWAMRSSRRLCLAGEQQPEGQQAAGDEESLQRRYCRQLLAAHFSPVLLPLALGGGAGAEAAAAAAARDVVTALLLQLVAPPGAAATKDSPVLVEAEEVIAAVGVAASAALAPLQEQEQEEADAAGADASIEAAVARLRQIVEALDPSDSSCPAAARQAAGRLVRAAAAALAPRLQSGRPLPAAASALLADGVRRFGVAAATGAGGGGGGALGMVRALVRAGAEAPLETAGSDAAAAASAALLVECLQSPDDPAAAWEDVITQLLLGADAAGAPLERRLRFAALLLGRLAGGAGALGTWRCGALDAGALRLFESVSLDGAAAGGSGGGEAREALLELLAQPAALAVLLPAVFELSWGHPGEREAAAAAEDEALSVWAAEGGASSSDSSSGDDDSGAGSGDEATSDGSGEGSSDAGGGEGGGAGGSADEGESGPVAAARAAAARLWDGGELLAVALECSTAPELEQATGGAADRVVDGVQGACASAAAGGGAAAGAGSIWAHRAAAAARGLRGRPHLRAALLERALSAAPGWQAWCTPRGAGGSGGSGGGSALMTEVAAALVLRVGPAEALSASQQLAAAAAAPSPGSAGPERALWLLGELLCAQEAASTGASGGAAAAAASKLADAASLLLRRALTDASDGAAADEALAGLLRTLWRGAASADGASGGVNVHAAALIRVLRAAAAPALLPLLASFCSQQLLPSASQAGGLAPAAAAALEAVVGALAPALRRGGEGAVSASGLDAMAVAVCRQAVDAGAGAGGSGGGEYGAPGARRLRLLRLAVAHFPVELAGEGGAAAAAAPLVGASTANERAALMALLRHASSGAGGGGEDGEEGEAEERERLASALQLRGVCYGWGDMAAAEWHAVLRDVQRHVGAARQEAQRAAGRLAAAACGAAAALLEGADGGGGGGGVIAPATAVQLLLKLSGKGLLRRHAAYEQLLGSFQQVLGGASLGVCWLPSLQLLGAVLRLQPEIQTRGRAPQLQLALGAAQAELYALVMALGAALAVASAAGAAAAAPVLSWLDARAAAGEWRLLAGCLEGAGEEAAAQALGAADARCEMVGFDSVGCLLALLYCPAASVAAATHHHHHHHHHAGCGRHHQAHHKQQQQQQQQRAGHGAGVTSGGAAPPGAGCAALEAVAWRLALQPQALSLVTYVESAADDAGEGGAPEFDDVDAVAFLTERRRRRVAGRAAAVGAAARAPAVAAAARRRGAAAGAGAAGRA
ncbi:hypothetical protein MNEG_5679 [Monoraphidium neglectum]|uniref:E3 ubiquitin-protein ligase listerin n=1 Tax=Monoraphidium neglectum TaxID=145388 RepID=A0A0D2L5H6_9CHLO|nr:hypothetical protein MNEG_5679 [Monoraphidium neglectum]KIZ02284.1 hypothetical protein MNEG_5679 [Monoraphidium neglectum]|eukprot:XP_013901303.1 hypothetical protein MNEG_5679 [Monoraphidium neglectum]